jgi:hypothetical protein
MNWIGRSVGRALLITFVYRKREEERVDQDYERKNAQMREVWF